MNIDDVIDQEILIDELYKIMNDSEIILFTQLLMGYTPKEIQKSLEISHARYYELLENIRRKMMRLEIENEFQDKLIMRLTDDRINNNRKGVGVS
jgi:hypothetical protein